MEDRNREIEKALDSVRKLLKPGEMIKIHITVKSDKPSKAKDTE